MKREPPAISPAWPPVAIALRVRARVPRSAARSSRRSRRSRRNTGPTACSPRCWCRSRWSGLRKSTSGKRAVRLKSASAEMPMPAAIIPPRYSALAETASNVMAVPRSTMTHGPPYLCKRGHAVHDPVRAHFRRILVEDVEAGIGVRRHEHRFGAEIALRHLRQRDCSAAERRKK